MITVITTIISFVAGFVVGSIVKYNDMKREYENDR